MSPFANSFLFLDNIDRNINNILRYFPPTLIDISIGVNCTAVHESFDVKRLAGISNITTHLNDEANIHDTDNKENME